MFFFIIVGSNMFSHAVLKTRILKNAYGKKGKNGKKKSFHLKK